MRSHSAGPSPAQKRPLAHGHGQRRGTPSARSTCLLSALAAALQATTRVWRQPRPCGRTRGPRAMLSPEAPGATLQGGTAAIVPRASAVGSPWPRRIPPAHEGMGGRCKGHDSHSSRPRSSGVGRPRSYPNTCQIAGWTPCWRKPICWRPRPGTRRRRTACTSAVRGSWGPCSWSSWHSGAIPPSWKWPSARS